MANSTASLDSDRASGYLQQVCMLLGHKVPVEFAPEAGRCTLPFGTCDLLAADSVLISTMVDEAASQARMEQLGGDHLARVAFRETVALDRQRGA